MISPFEEVSDFHVHLEVDGKHLELAEIHRRLREDGAATVQLRVSTASVSGCGDSRA